MSIAKQNYQTDINGDKVSVNESDQINNTHSGNVSILSMYIYIIVPFGF